MLISIDFNLRSGLWLSLTNILFNELPENKLWFTPQCTGNGSDGQVGPCPRAFHVAVSIDCNMFVFGGRLGGKRFE